MKETHPIPKIAQAAADLLKKQFDRDANDFGNWTLELLGLDVNDPTWHVDFLTGTVSREVPEQPPDA